MKTPPFEIKKYGSNALLLEWPKRVDLKILMEILSFQEYLRKNHLPGDFWEFVPIYHSLTLINRSGTVDLESIAKELPAWYEGHPKGLTVKTQKWELPVCYEDPYSLDLDDSARRLGMGPEGPEDPAPGVSPHEGSQGLGWPGRRANGDLSPGIPWRLADYRELPHPTIQCGKRTTLPDFSRRSYPVPGRQQGGVRIA